MRARRDYRHVRSSESVTSSATSSYVNQGFPLHLITSNSTQGEEFVNIADGSIVGERHYFLLVSLGHANDYVFVKPDTAGAGTQVALGNQVGRAVTLVWNGSAWHAISVSTQGWFDTLRLKEGIATIWRDDVSGYEPEVNLDNAYAPGTSQDWTCGTIGFGIVNDNNELVRPVEVVGYCDSPNDGAEEGAWHVKTMIGGSLAIRQQLDANGTHCDPGCYGERQAVTSTSNSVAINMRDGFIAYHLLTENTTIAAPSNPQTGMELTLMIKQAAGSSYTVAFNSVFLLSGAAFTMTTTNNAIDVLRFVYDGVLSKWVEVSRSQDVR